MKTSNSYSYIISSIGLLQIFCAQLIAYSHSDDYLTNYTVYSALIFYISGTVLAFLIYLRPNSDWVVSLVVLNYFWFNSLVQPEVPLHLHSFILASVLSLFFKFTRMWVYPALMVFGYAMYMGALYYRGRHNLLEVAIHVDDYILWLSALLVTVLGTHYFNFYRANKEQEKMRRLGLIGHEAHRIIHDLKGMISTPLLHLEKLKNLEIKSENEKLIEEKIKMISDDMEMIRHAMKNINGLSFGNSQSHYFNIKKSIEDAHEILKSRLHSVSICPSIESLQCFGSPSVLTSVFFNLFLNTIEANSQNRLKPTEIKIYTEGRKLIYEDNAGGSCDRANRKTTVAEGSGIGMYLLKRDLASMEVDLKIKQGKEGLRFELMFPVRS